MHFSGSVVLTDTKAHLNATCMKFLRSRLIVHHLSTMFQDYSLKLLGQFLFNFIYCLQAKGQRKFTYVVQVIWPKWMPCPYMVKTYKNLLHNHRTDCLELSLVELWEWGGRAASTKFILMMTFSWLQPILRQGRIWCIMLWNRENWKVHFSSVVLSDMERHLNWMPIKFTGKGFCRARLR